MDSIHRINDEDCDNTNWKNEVSSGDVTDIKEAKFGEYRSTFGTSSEDSFDDRDDESWDDSNMSRGVKSIEQWYNYKMLMEK